MATNYAANVSPSELTIIRSGLALLVSALAPYRDHPVISKKVFGFFTISITWGDVLDALTKSFGVAHIE